MSGFSRWGQMSERKQFRAIKGTRDILPPDSALWNWFEHTAREVFESYNFGEIRLPIFEQTGLFARAVGADTDVVKKEMFSFDLHASHDLEARRDAMIGTRIPDPFDFAGSTHQTVPETEIQIGAFIRIIDNATREDRFALTPENVRALDGLRTLHQQFQAVCETYRESFPPEDPKWNPETQTLFEGIASYAAKLNFGSLVSLRPEATASVCRAYIEHNMQALSGNQKLYYIGPMFRRERPQKGRYRQFYQIGAEVLGQSDAPAIDAEVLEMLLVFFNRVGLTRTTLSVNSIGDRNCRPQYVEILRKALLNVRTDLKEDSRRRIETNPLRVLDSKIPEEQPIIETLPRISDHLCDECRAHFARLKEELNLRRIDYQENWRLVRGLDYYTRTTFEVTAEGLGSQNAVCGGGRYDGLVELLGGPPTKGIGFAIGTDRSILSIEESGNAPKLGGLAVYIAWMGQASYPTAVNIARKLRAAGLSAELPPEDMKFKKSLGLADKLGARYALIIGEDEVASRTFTLKRLADGDQKKFAEGELLEYLESERRR
jgi:histidyl-tRNA synthetase